MKYYKLRLHKKSLTKESAFLGNRRKAPLVMGHKRDLEELRRAQTEIAAKVVLEDRFEKPIEVVTGSDLAFLNSAVVAAAVSLDYESLQVIEEKAVIGRVSFPYIPTFLGFREGPPIIELVGKLKVKPDILMLNAHGISHPLFCGCASHVGVLTNIPTVGVAKSKLCGEYQKEPERVGEWVPLMYGEKTVGALLKSKRGCRPIFVSPGHLVSLESSIQIAKRCIGDHKLPEPLYLAHRLANEERRRSLP